MFFIMQGEAVTVPKVSAGRTKLIGVLHAAHGLRIPKVGLIADHQNKVSFIHTI
jgi:hypothetical protein